MTTLKAMAGLLLPLAAFGVTAAAAGVASAAPPDYCALYSREYAIDTVQPQAAASLLQSVQDQAYYRCLNQDEDPSLPQTSAYFGTVVTNNPTDAQATAPVASAAIPVVPAPPQPRPGPAPPTASAVTASTYRNNYHGSGMTPWTPEWKAWCAQNFPNSWDPNTGTILNYGADRRELCK